MLSIKQLINDNVIDKEQLILKRHSYLDLDSQQAQFISKLFKNDSLDFSKLTMIEISKEFCTDVKTTEVILRSLLSNAHIQLLSLNKKIYFDFNFLINKLFNSYFMPKRSESLDIKLNWIKNSFCFKLTETNLTDLKKLIENEDWNRLSVAVTKLVNDKKANWPLFIAILSAVSHKGTHKEEKNLSDFKNVLDENWLEE